MIGADFKDYHLKHYLITTLTIREPNKLTDKVAQTSHTKHDDAFSAEHEIPLESPNKPFEFSVQKEGKSKNKESVWKII